MEGGRLDDTYFCPFVQRIGANAANDLVGHILWRSERGSEVRSVWAKVEDAAVQQDESTQPRT